MLNTSMVARLKKAFGGDFCRGRRQLSDMHKTGDFPIMGNIMIAALLLLLSVSSDAVASENDVFEIETEGRYRMKIGVSTGLAKEMALFIAKGKAVDLAGKYLSRKGLIKVYELKRDEIYSLTAREIQSRILDQGQQTVGTTTTYRLRIKAHVRASDFITAEMKDLQQEKKEARETWRQEMEQPVSAEIDPGRDIAKGYRLIREEKWRIAMIYLNHLEKKYPNWDSIYMAKAIAHYVLHEPEFMKEALNQACNLDNQIACDDLQHLKRLNEHDFGLSVPK